MIKESFNHQMDKSKKVEVRHTRPAMGSQVNVWNARVNRIYYKQGHDKLIIIRILKDWKR